MKKKEDRAFSSGMRLSDHCVVDHFESAEGFEASFSPKWMVVFPMMMMDRRMHFTGLRGKLWRMLGVDRSPKNPNICNL
ncbi:MAG: hypothetical protein FJ317_09420 [SAR202 cluster bacterium]|nr:hypothetical protein [SAR202 cluster bacterium]